MEEKSYIIMETVSVTYFYRVKASNEKEAKEKLYSENGEVQENILDTEFHDDAIYEIVEEEKYFKEYL
jgi:hypothetical protein